MVPELSVRTARVAAVPPADPIATPAGCYRPHTSDDQKLLVPNMEKMYGLIRTGYAAGFVSNVHAIGDKGTALREILGMNVDLTMVDGRIVFERQAR